MKETLEKKTEVYKEQIENYVQQNNVDLKKLRQEGSLNEENDAE